MEISRPAGRPGFFVVHGHNGDFNQTAFQSVEQPKITYYPRERAAEWVTAAMDVKRCRREINACLDIPCAIDFFESGYPLRGVFDFLLVLCGWFTVNILLWLLS